MLYEIRGTVCIVIYLLKFFLLDRSFMKMRAVLLTFISPIALLMYMFNKRFAEVACGGVCLSS